MGASASASSSVEVEAEGDAPEPSPLVALLDSHGRQWGGPAAGIFFERDPAPAVIAYCAEEGVGRARPGFTIS